MSPQDLGRYLRSQLESFFPDGRSLDGLAEVVPLTLERVEHCFARIRLGSYCGDTGPTFSHLHSDQYASFLYLASNTAWRRFADVELAAKLFALNKALNGIVCMYDTELPDVFILIHTVGMVLGKATYGNYFVACQNCLVGSDRGASPVLSEGVVMFGASSIIGNSHVGEGVSVAAGATILNASIPARSIVAGRSPDIVVKPAKRDLVGHYFDRSVP